MPEKIKYSVIKTMCGQLMPRQVLQIMLQFTVKAVYAEHRLQQEIDTIERVLFPPAMVAQGDYSVPLARHHINEQLARARIKLVRDDGTGRVTSIDHSIYQCLIAAEELKHARDDLRDVSGDKVMLAAYECFNRILPVLGYGVEELGDAVAITLEV